MITQLTEGFILGLATGTTCLATCGPIYAPYLMQYDRNIIKSIMALMEISAGRFITYALVGALAGLLGAGIPTDQKIWFTSAAYLLLSVFLIITAFRTHKKETCCTSGKWAKVFDRPLLLGLFTGINICPSFLIALTKAVDLSGPVAGVALFVSFFIGTSIFLLPLSVFGFFGVKKQFRTIARFSALVVSVWFITQSAVLAYHQVTASNDSTIDPSQIVNVMDSRPLYILSNDSTSLQDLRDQFASRKGTEVHFVSDPAALPVNGVVITGKEIASSHTDLHALRKSGRFIVVLPEESRKKPDKTQINNLMNFLAFYQFKVDADSGSIFEIPESAYQ